MTNYTGISVLLTNIGLGLRSLPDRQRGCERSLITRMPGWCPSPTSRRGCASSHRPRAEQSGPLQTARRSRKSVGKNWLISGWKPTNFTSVLSLLDGTTLTAFADVNTDVRREKADVRWVGFLPPGLIPMCLSLFIDIGIFYGLGSEPGIC